MKLHFDTMCLLLNFPTLPQEKKQKGLATGQDSHLAD